MDQNCEIVEYRTNLKKVVLKSIESALERMVEGTFSRAFKAELQPVELGRRLIKEAASSKKLDVNGRPIVPNEFIVHLSPTDYEQFEAVETSLRKELTASLRDFADSENFGFLGPIEIDLESDDKVKVGLTSILPAFAEPAHDEESNFVVEIPGGNRFRLHNRPTAIGRHNECEIVIEDENISRRHAELRPSGDTFELVDLGSTNGCQVNGESAQSVLLKDGDEITLGPVQLWFREG